MTPKTQRRRNSGENFANKMPNTIKDIATKTSKDECLAAGLAMKFFIFSSRPNYERATPFLVNPV
jgi:hypothetical protein